MPTQTVNSTASESLPKKIFISYSRRDKRWVDEYLERVLNAAEVGFAIDDKDFPIGGQLDESIRKTIKECRCVLLIMTPEWVRGKWTHYEALLAVEQDVDAALCRVLPIKLKDCEVPPNIASRLYVDMCKARGRDDQIAYLLKQIGVSEEGIAKARNSVAKKSLLLLMELLDEPRAREAVNAFQKMFPEIQQSNDILTSHKQLHDDLQSVQLFRSLMRDPPSEQAGQGDWKTVGRDVSALRQQVETLLNHVASVTDPQVDVAFADPFAGLSDDLDLAWRSRDASRYSKHLANFSILLERSLVRINDRIVQHVSERRLADLSEILGSIYDELIKDVTFDEAAAALLDKFRSGISELVELDKAIRERVVDHKTLQDAETDPTMGLGEPTLKDISDAWKRIERWVGKLKLVDRYEKLFAYFHQICAQLKDDRTVRDDHFEDAVKSNFVDFVNETRRAFNKLDIDLLAICRQLKPHSNELQQLLNRMQNYDAEV